MLLRAGSNDTVLHGPGFGSVVVVVAVSSLVVDEVNFPSFPGFRSVFVAVISESKLFVL